MSEYPPKTPPMEKLRQSLLIDALEGFPTDLTVKKTISPLEQARTMTPVISEELRSIGSLESEELDRREFSRSRLEKMAADCSFGSVDELESALLDLRGQIKEEMPRKEWNIYFGENP